MLKLDQKIYYLIVKGKSKKWMDFEQLDDYLDLVIEYENKTKREDESCDVEDETPET